MTVDDQGEAVSKTYDGAKAVIKIGDKIIGEIKNITWRKAGDPIPMDKPEFDWFKGNSDQPRLIINGEEVPWDP